MRKWPSRASARDRNGSLLTEVPPSPAVLEEKGHVAAAEYVEPAREVEDEGPGRSPTQPHAEEEEEKGFAPELDLLAPPAAAALPPPAADDGDVEGGGAESSGRRAIELELRPVGAAELAAAMEALQGGAPSSSAARQPLPPAATGCVEVLLGLGLSAPHICAMWATERALLARGREALVGHLDVLLRAGVTPTDFQKMLRRGTRWLGKPAAQVEAAMAYLGDLLGDESLAARLVASAPHLLVHSRESLEEKVARLYEEGLPHVVTVIARYPDVLSHIRDGEAGRKYANLRQVVGDDEVAARVLATYPGTLLRASSATVRASLLWLEATFGATDARRMVFRCGQLLGTRPETAGTTYAELAAAFGAERARAMILQVPRVLQQQWPALAPKLAYFSAGGGRAAGGLAVVAACPKVLLYSLERRIVPRIEALRGAGKQFKSIESVLMYTDKEFERVLGVAPLPPAAASAEEAPEPRRATRGRTWRTWAAPRGERKNRSRRAALACHGCRAPASGHGGGGLREGLSTPAGQPLHGAMREC